MQLYYRLIQNSASDRTETSQTIALWRQNDPEISEKEIERTVENNYKNGVSAGGRQTGQSLREGKEKEISVVAWVDYYSITI